MRLDAQQASTRRDILRADHAFHQKEVASTPILRDLLSSTTMENLEKFIRDVAMWPAFAPWGLSRGKFEDLLSDFHKFRKPMARVRDVSEAVHTKGQAAVNWFEARPGIVPTP